MKKTLAKRTAPAQRAETTTYFQDLARLAERYWERRGPERETLLKAHQDFREHGLREYGFASVDDLEAWLAKTPLGDLAGDLRVRWPDAGKHDDAALVSIAFQLQGWLGADRGPDSPLSRALLLGLVPIVTLREAWGLHDADEATLLEIIERPPVIILSRVSLPERSGPQHFSARALGHGGDCDADDMPGEMIRAFVALIEAILTRVDVDDERVRAAYHAFAPAFWEWRENAAPESAGRIGTPIASLFPFDWLDENMLTVIRGDPAETTFTAFSDDGSSPNTHWSRTPGKPPQYNRGDKGTVLSVGGPPATPITVQREEFIWNKIVRGLMNDETRKTFAFVMARCIGAGGDREVRFHVNDLLAFRGGIKKHHGRDYRPEHKREERDRLWALTETWMQVYDRVDELMRNGKTRPRTVKLTSRLIDVGFESERALPLDSTSQDVPYGVRIRLGSWATPYLANLPRYAVPIFEKIGRYDPANPVERLALRIALFLSFTWSGEPTHEKTVAELLRTATIDKPKVQPDRFREAFEGALQRLHADGIIGGWQYGEGADEAALTRKWLETWLRWPVILHAPAEMLAGNLKPARGVLPP